MRVVALIAIRNEEMFIERCLEHLYRQGVETCIIDNGSTDRSLEIVQSYCGRGVIRIETLPYNDCFDLARILQCKETLTKQINADWFMHHDADEIREAPTPFRTLVEGLVDADRRGFNAVNFDEFVFLPTDDAQSYEHKDYVARMQYYYFFEPQPLRRVNAWKNDASITVDMVNSAGHAVSFEGRKVFPVNFILRHYICLSRAHAIAKYGSRVFALHAVTKRGWSKDRAGFTTECLKLPARSRLKRISDMWDKSDPWTCHESLFGASPRQVKVPTQGIGSTEMAGLPGRGLRVLYALSRYPHLSHTYMMTEIETMRRFGVQVDVYSTAPPFVSFETDVPLHKGSLAEAIRVVKPDLVHVHWTHWVARFRDDVERAGLPLTVRGHHPHDKTSKIADSLQYDPVVRRVYMFGHFADLLPAKYSKVMPVDACFDPTIYYPEPQTDRSLVVRAAPGRKVKDLELFIRVAARCRNHRFVLAPATTSEGTTYFDELRELNRSFGDPVEIRVDMPHREVAELMRKAGIFLYTVLPSEEYSMPISVSEAMGAGCLVLNRLSDNARVHQGNSGAMYNDEDEAVSIIQESLTWSSDRWNEERSKTLARAEQLASPIVLRPILDDWLRIVQRTAGDATLSGSAEARPSRLGGIGSAVVNRLRRWLPF